MLGKLTGIIDEVNNDNIILDVRGVGYLIYMPGNVIASLALGKTYSFYIHTYVREDALRLFGFLQKAQLEWFLLLQNVPGVGAKVALAILGNAELVELSAAVASGNVSALSRAPGVGQKVATRIILELKNKIKSIYSDYAVSNIGTNSVIGKPGAADDAISVLLNLSYSKEQASNAVALALQELTPEAECAQIVRISLKKLAIA
ncbi:Holliday junction branch migration protein RuvA [Bartonella sp. TP]|uniref:Holliday junction branch migration protein RuvA n=1 Tax=Bartonella sp. TP TaxID=3057550 RepID=UPI0025B0F7CA|nr:Holliday junction branch migration protein RuvA [Bartonella sp. TP]MDN5248717.1 Holliday junction branch migration protein RuvA [Alphaproteobacteria bacterium]WJW79623.1 Holliday junction branch migration protein RuvA [Bartonella sp. TP]